MKQKENKELCYEDLLDHHKDFGCHLGKAGATGEFKQGVTPSDLYLMGFLWLPP